MLDYKEIIRDLAMLHRSASGLGNWQKDHNQILIDVGEYGLALDGIAFAYLTNNAVIPADQYKVFRKLAEAMELEKDPELDAVAKLTARFEASPVERGQPEFEALKAAGH